MRPTFGRAVSVDQKPKIPKKEKIVAWIKTTASGEEYISVKINDVEGKTLNLRAYRKSNKSKDIMPDYVGYEKVEHASTN